MGETRGLYTSEVLVARSYVCDVPVKGSWCENLSIPAVLMISCAICALDLIDGVLCALNSIFCCSSPALYCFTPDLNLAIYGKSLDTCFYDPSTDARFQVCVCFAFLRGGLYSSFRYDIPIGVTDDIGGIITIVDLEGLTVYCWFGVIIYRNELWLCCAPVLC